MREITVVIAGKTNVGKSTVAQIISDALKAYNIKHRLVDDDRFDPIYKEKAIGVAEKSEVFIKTVRVSRDLTPASERGI